MAHKIVVAAAPFIVSLFWLFTYCFWAHKFHIKIAKYFAMHFGSFYSIVIICLVCPLLI